MIFLFLALVAMLFSQAEFSDHFGRGQHEDYISEIIIIFVLFCCFTLQSTAMVITGRSVYLTTLFPGQA